MSQRSIIEINHDQSFMVEAHGEHFVKLLRNALASGSDESWEQLRGWGIKRITQCHHSEDRKVVVNGREYEFG